MGYGTVCVIWSRYCPNVIKLLWNGFKSFEKIHIWLNSGAYVAEFKQPHSSWFNAVIQGQMSEHVGNVWAKHSFLSGPEIFIHWWNLGFSAAKRSLYILCYEKCHEFSQLGNKLDSMSLILAINGWLVGLAGGRSWNGKHGSSNKFHYQSNSSAYYIIPSWKHIKS